MGGAVGVVPLEGRGALPFLDLHGEPLVVHAARSLARAGLRRVVVTAADGTGDLPDRLDDVPVTVRPANQWWRGASEHARLVLADPLCPLVPPEFVARVLAATPADAVAACYRPVTDTVKTVVDAVIADTLDRDTLAVVASPVVLPGHLAAEEAPPVHDFARLVAWLRERGPVELVEAPSMARRVADESALRVLECLEELTPGGRAR